MPRLSQLTNGGRAGGQAEAEVQTVAATEHLVATMNRRLAEAERRAHGELAAPLRGLEVLCFSRALPPALRKCSP